MVAKSCIPMGKRLMHINYKAHTSFTITLNRQSISSCLRFHVCARCTTQKKRALTLAVSARGLLYVTGLSGARRPLRN